MTPNRYRAFTLIELLAVGTLIGILTILTLGPIRAGQIRSRDTRRKADLNLLAQAVDLYYSENKSYPDGTNGCLATSQPQQADPWIPALSTRYLPRSSGQALPRDPRNSGLQFYTYKNLQCQDPSATQSYELSAPLENKNDPQAADGVYKVVR